MCYSTQFDVRDGNILKYAVSNRFDDFIDEVIEWGVNLNRVDEHDNRTILDYIEFHVRRNKGNSLEERFQMYYDQFKDPGPCPLQCLQCPLTRRLFLPAELEPDIEENT